MPEDKNQKKSEPTGSGLVLKLKNIILNNRKELWKVVMVLSIVLFFILCFFLIRNILSFYRKIDIPAQENNQDKEIDYAPKKFNPPCDGCLRRKLDGIYVKPEEARLLPVAIMIDNHYDAWPIFGLDKALLVYEAEAEGRFTRYMAIFNLHNKIAEIGPVRSARPYFVDWVDGLNALYCHCGGSPQALVEIKQKDIFDINEFYNAPYYWRDSRRQTPHNILTSSQRLKDFLDEEGVREGNFEAWKFKDDEPVASTTNAFIKIGFKPQGFDVAWKYSRERNAYLRYLGEELQLTADGEEIWARNIIIQYVTAEVLDEKLRLRMETIGTGEAIVCLDGGCNNAQWKKEASGKRTQFFDKEDIEIEFNAGTTWVEVVRPDVEISFDSEL